MEIGTLYNSLTLLFTMYMLGLYACYAALSVLSLITVWYYFQTHRIASIPSTQSSMEIPVSILAPAYNEEAGICQSIHALLQLRYPIFEVIVINDGSTDNTLSELIREFELVPFPEAYRVSIKTQPLRTLYTSRIYRNLRVIDKENGGKADALNAGINAARYPVFCAVDADSILQPDSLSKIMTPFMEHSDTIAAGGTVRIVNGCKVESGVLLEAGLPKNPLALFQVVEYLRGFLFGRLGWSPLNALLIVSGAFGVFSRKHAIEVGGYRHKTIGEDMELIVRLHRMMRKKGERYRITFVPDPICWTEAPEDIKTLRNQRIRWQVGLHESLAPNMGILFHLRGGAVGWLALPYMLLFEWFGPIAEAAGITITVVGYLLGLLTTDVVLLFFLIAVGVGTLLSVVAVLLEEITFHQYPKISDTVKLLIVALFENFGYRQMTMYWRVVAMVRIALRRKTKWGAMKRSALGQLKAETRPKKKRA